MIRSELIYLGSRTFKSAMVPGPDEDIEWTERIKLAVNLSPVLETRRYHPGCEKPPSIQLIYQLWTQLKGDCDSDRLMTLDRFVFNSNGEFMTANRIAAVTGYSVP